MFYISGPDIYIHRGDSANFDLVFGEVPDISTEGTIPSPWGVIDAMMVPAVEADVADGILDIGLEKASFPVYPSNAIIVKDVYGINWVPEDGTILRFSVKCDVDRPKCIIQKDYIVNNGFVSIDLEPRDTWFLPFGEYTWDFRLSFDDADYYDWNTPINPSKFVICENVSNN